MPSDPDGAYAIRRRQLLQLGVGSVAAALGARSTSEASPAGQTPGSGQGRLPRPPLTDAVVNVSAMRVEDWTEPWVWRPSDWPGQPLALNIVGNPHPPRAISPGNRFTPLYSFNGSSPGPTIRMRGDECLRVTLRNHLGPSMGRVPRGAAADPFEVHPDRLAAALCRMQTAVGQPCEEAAAGPTIFGHFHEFFVDTPNDMVDVTCVGGHVNVPHGTHATNLHTHGLHVEPGVNPNGTVGDNTFLRVLPRADGQFRTTSRPGCRDLAAH
jgi:FtsP/CotA-like multicopper oxidase with cupredoxin domain